MPREFRHLSVDIDELVAQSRSVSHDLFERFRKLVEAIEVDRDAPLEDEDVGET